MLIHTLCFSLSPASHLHFSHCPAPHQPGDSDKRAATSVMSCQEILVYTWSSTGWRSILSIFKAFIVTKTYCKGCNKPEPQMIRVLSGITGNFVGWCIYSYFGIYHKEIFACLLIFIFGQRSPGKRLNGTR